MTTSPASTRILVIEDQNAMRENLVTLLELEGFTVFSAPNGARGIELAATVRPDIVLCDVMMPEMDGYAVLAALRQNRDTAAVPFIFLTAKGARAEVRAGMNLGADDYLVKPMRQAELLEAIAARLERQRVLEMSRNSAPNFDSPEPLQSLGLTTREAEVLLWVAQGKGNQDVGLLLEINECTVKRHLLNIFQKLGVETRTAAALRAIEVLSRGRRNVVTQTTDAPVGRGL